MPNSPLHRIDPQWLTTPQFYSSAGEPSLLSVPNLTPQMRGMPMQQGGALSPLMGLLAAGGMFAPNDVQTPQMPQMPRPMDKVNDEPLDVMPDVMKFKDAFGLARRTGLVQFTWRGKSYTTQLKEP